MIDPRLGVPPQPFVLGDSTWERVRASAFEVAVLPWGATEAHNTHLPYATDTIETQFVATAAAKVAWERGARVLVLPAVPFGVNTGQREVPFCLNMMPGTQAALLRDILPALQDHGVRKLVILNGHGGNDFKQIIRELQPSTPMVLSQVNWYQVVPAAEYFDEPGDHAGELETSVMLEIAPGLVRPLGRAGPGKARSHKIAAFREGWAWTPRPWLQVTDDTGVGNPARATHTKGAAYIDAVTEKLATFFCDLAAIDPASMYE